MLLPSFEIGDFLKDIEITVIHINFMGKKMEQEAKITQSTFYNSCTKKIAVMAHLDWIWSSQLYWVISNSKDKDKEVDHLVLFLNEDQNDKRFVSCIGDNFLGQMDSLGNYQGLTRQKLLSWKWSWPYKTKTFD